MKKKSLFLLGILNIVAYFFMILNSIALSVGGYFLKDTFAIYNKNSFILWAVTIISIIMFPIMVRTITLVTRDDIDIDKGKGAFKTLCILTVLMVATGVGGLFQLILMIPFLVILKLKEDSSKANYSILIFTLISILTYGYLIGGMTGELLMLLVILPIGIILFLSKKDFFVVKFRFSLLSIAVALAFIGGYFYTHMKVIEPDSEFTKRYKNIEKLKEEAIKEVDKMPLESLYIKDNSRLNNSPNVILYFTGGATTKVKDHRDDFFDDLPENVDIVDINQTQFGRPFDFADGKTSDDKLLKTSLVNAAIAQRLSNKFASEGKKVILAGHSYGALLVPFTLTNYPEIQKDLVGSVMMAGRLKMPEKVALNFNKGNILMFDNEAGSKVEKIIPLYLINNFEEKLKHAFSAPVNSQDVSGYIRSFTNMAAVNSMVGGIDYTKKMSLKDTLKFIGVYATNDEAVGTLTPEEIETIKKFGDVIVVKDGTHQLNGLEDRLNIKIKEIFNK